MSWRTLASAIFLSALWTSAYAQFYQCNGCTTSQYSSLARSLGASQGIGNKYVADFTNHNGTEWNVTREPNGHGYTYFADPVTLSSLFLSAFADYDVVYNTYQTNDIYVTVPEPRPAGYPTGYDGTTGLDWVSSGTYLGGIGTWLNLIQAGTFPDSWLPGSVVALFLAWQSGVTVNSWNPTIVFVIQLDDKSVVTISYTGTPHPKLEKVVDPFGNVIPLTKSEARGTYSFGGGQPSYGQNFGSWLAGLGLKMISNGTTMVATITCDGVTCYEKTF